MCTALSLKTNNSYFGRNLDLDRSYGEEVCVMPRSFPLEFRTMGRMQSHLAIIGMATVVDGLPLFYDGVNEKGLAMAGLNFPGNAYYAPLAKDKDNIAPFEFIPWILGQCATVDEAEILLSRINLADINYSEKLPAQPLHWMIADKQRSIVAEFMKNGMHLHENPIGVLTNNPPFEHHLANLEKYKGLRNDNAKVDKEKYTNIAGERGRYSAYCQGLGAVGLPGDVSSMSRFVRIAFNRANSVCEVDEISSVTQFFHLLSSVAMVKGACKTDEDTLDITVYSSCINQDKGLYYYTTCTNSCISCVDMHKTDLESDKIIRFKLVKGQSVEYQN